MFNDILKGTRGPKRHRLTKVFNYVEREAAGKVELSRVIEDANAFTKAKNQEKKQARIAREGNKKTMSLLKAQKASQAVYNRPSRILRLKLSVANLKKAIEREQQLARHN